MDREKNRRFYSFEGIDYSGKSTQIKLLKSYLEQQGQQVYVLREPGGTDISEKIREVLLDNKNHNMSDFCEIFLYSAARTQLVSEKIIPLLEKGFFVLADRYVDSTTAYQGYGRGIDEKLVRQINTAATLGLMPATTFLMNMEPEVFYERSKKAATSADRLEDSGREFFNRVYKGYLEIAQNEPGRYAVLDANAAKDDVHKQIVEIVKSKEK